MEQLTYTGSGRRIDIWLTEQFPYSRNFFQHIIKRGGVVVNGNQVKKSYQLKAGDTIAIDNLERFLDGGILEEAPAIPVDIRHEHDDYLVLYKPKGVLSHPKSIRDIGQPSVVGGLYHHFKQQEAEQPSLPSSANFIRAGLLHRLDKDTDGLMIIAKTEDGLTYFKELFQRKSTARGRDAKEAVPLHKYYRATCALTLLGETFLEQLASDGLPYYIDEPVKAKLPHPKPPKQGITKIIAYEQPQREDEGTVTLDLEILTGRTHQIRYHLSNHGLPVVGDYLYGKKETTPLQLTAYKLVFEDIDGEEVTISS